MQFCSSFKGTISIAAQAGDNPNNGDKEVAFKNSAPFTDCISEINNTQTDNAKFTDVVMSVYNLIEYSDNYSKQEIYGNTIEMNQFQLMLMLSKNFMLMIITVLRLNFQ